MKGSPIGFKEGKIKFEDAPPVVVSAPSFEGVGQHFDDGASGTATFEVRQTC